MSKKSLYKSEIENTLKKSSHNLEKLYKSVKTVEKFRGNDKPFYGALMDLLKEKKIAISGYDFNIHNVEDGRIQSFMKQGVMLEWVKREQTEIFSLLNQMEEPTPSVVKKAKNQLRKIFERKFRQYEKQEIEIYKQIKVICQPLTEELKEIEAELQEKISEYDGYSGHSLEISKLKAQIESVKRSLVKNPNYRVWKIYDWEKTAGRSHLKSPTSGEQFNSLIVVDYDGSYTLEQVLEHEGIFKPEEQTLEDVRTLFNRLLFFVNSHKNYNFMKQSFALALSDEEDSMDWFELFIKNFTTPVRKLKEELELEKYKEKI